MSELAALQSAMLAACTAGEGVDAAVSAVRGAGRMAPQARLGIYARGYRARLLECLRGEYKVTRAVVGEQVFDLFALGYIEANPPRSPSMFDLGARFADYLDDTRPSDADAIARLPADVARLDRARLESRRAAGVESIPGDRSIDAATVLTNPELRVRVPASLVLLRLGFDVLAAVAAADRGQPVPTPAAVDSYVAVARRRYRVAVHALAPWQYALLLACGSDATRLRAVVAGEEWPVVASWLPAAVDAGMLTTG
ncbi:MAG TPA: DNA-binding domain-containing protein [Acidimicrobiales bacterium]|nr:DNA-binding domain-containing protein [Acidimicrobiales bacterium]